MHGNTKALGILHVKFAPFPKKDFTLEDEKIFRITLRMSAGVVDL